MPEEKKIPTNPTVKRVRKDTSKIQNKKVKAGTKAGGKGLLIGIGLFVFFIIFLIFGFFFYLTANPGAAKGLGIGTSTIKSVTSVFAGLVFGSLFILFLILGISYVYKLATQNTNKVKNTIGAFVVFILGLINISLGWLVYSRIAKIKVDTFVNTKDVLISYVNYMGKNMQEEIVPMYTNKYPLIAPIKISFQLNKRIYENTEYPKIYQKYGAIKAVKFVLDCGNGQILNYPANGKFSYSKYCLYLQKTSEQNPYKVKLSLVFKTKRGDIKTYNFPTKEIFIDSNIKIKNKYKLNDQKNQIILGERGDEVRLDLSKIPDDITSIDNYDFDVDFEGKGDFQTYNGEAKYVYGKDGAYKIVVRIPNQDLPYYYFPVRIKPATKPVCNITYKEKNGIYYFKIKGEKADNPIRNYTYELKNLEEGETIKKGRGTSLKISLQNGSSYQLIAKVTDTSGKKGTCSSNIIDLTNKINYKFDIIVNNKKLKENEIVVKKLPGIYNIKIENIVPKKNNLDVGFDLDNDGVIDEKTNNYTVKIKKKEDKIINLIVKDAFGNKTIKKINFKVDLQPVIAKLEVNKDTGEAPLTIKFDASTSEVTNNDDEIIYYNRDFGDGKTLFNTRRGNIEHTYKKFGKYIASVEVETKKGYKSKKEVRIDVYRPVNSSKIYFPNNLGGQASVGSPVTIKLNTSGAVKSIEWDFGDGNTNSCDGRECTTVIHTYNKKGYYKVRAKVEYLDDSPVSTAQASIYIIDNQDF